MKKSDVKKVAEQIDLEIKKTEEVILEYKETAQPIAPENAVGRLSRMDAINNQGVMKAALRKAEEKLKGLIYLKGKINDADFGLCHQCKNEIPLPRLLFRPQSAYCVRCAN